jgi:hypothetical protein
MENKKSNLSIIQFLPQNKTASSIHRRILLDMFKLGEGSRLGIPKNVGSSQIMELKYAGLIDIDRKNNIFPTRQGVKLLEGLILGEDDCVYPLKEANAAEKFKKGIPLHLLAKSSSIARL